VVYVRLILCTTLADLEELSINLLPVLRAVQTQQTENGGVDESDDSYAAVTTRPGVIGRPSVNQTATQEPAVYAPIDHTAKKY